MPKYTVSKKTYSLKVPYDRKPTRKLAAKIQEVNTNKKNMSEGLVKRVIRETRNIVNAGFNGFGDAYDYYTRYQIKHGRTPAGLVLGTYLYIYLDGWLKLHK
jgi:hypothetical protein